MWSINYNFKSDIYNKNGYDYITSFKLYIPIKEIGLNVLVRNETQLPFFYEIILKLINNNINNIVNISEITGVETEILYDVIGDMSVNELVYVVGEKLKLTQKGKDTLKTLIQVSIEKDVIRRIYVDCINGKIIEPEKVVKKVEYNSSWLEDCIKIDEDFIQKNYSKFNNIYLSRQEEMSSGEYRINCRNEIYQILNKEYENMCYTQKEINVYRNISDGLFTFEDDSNIEEEYISVLIEQINSKFGARKFLVSENQLNKKNISPLSIDDELSKNTNALTNLPSESGKDIIEKYYFKNRYLYKNELKKILLNMKNIRPTTVIIKSSNLNRILDDNIINILNILVNRTTIKVIADKTEKNIDELNRKCLKINKKNKINWTYQDDIVNEEILIYPYSYIKTYKSYVLYDKDYIIKEISEVYFDKDSVEKRLKELSI